MQYDTILCFGFFYHTVKQHELLTEVHRINPKTFILDTKVKKVPRVIKLMRYLQKCGLIRDQRSWLHERQLKELLAEHYIVIRPEKISDESNTIDNLELVAVPTEAALRLLLKSYRFEFEKINWNLEQIKEWHNLKDYKAARRVSYIASC